MEDNNIENNKPLTSAEWSNIWLFSIYVTILAIGFGVAYRVIRIDKNIETLIKYEQSK